MGFLFLHCNFCLTSWYVTCADLGVFNVFSNRDYIWAPAGIYQFAWFARYGLTLFRNGLRHTASFKALPDRMVRVCIPTRLKWSPGQHYFVRFLDMGAHALTSHPFTVSTLHQSGTLKFCICVCEGMTGRLASCAEKQNSSLVMLDGPYGGIHGSLRVYDRVVLLAGGSGLQGHSSVHCHGIANMSISGASFTVPLLLELIQGFGMGMVCKHVHFIWAVTDVGNVNWIHASPTCLRFNRLECAEYYEAALKNVPDGSVTLSVYVTGTSRSSSPSSSTKEESKPGMETYSGRPNLAQLVKDACSAGRTVGLASS